MATRPHLHLLPNAPSADPALRGSPSERELFDLVYLRMRSLTGAGASDLDDLVQMAAEQVFRSLGTFRRDSELSTWLYGVCYRVLLSQRRWYRRWASRFSLSDDAEAAGTAEVSPAVLFEQRERAEVLRAVLLRMSDKYRVVVVLHDLEELSIPEIAAIVGANELTVRSRLRDGRKQLFRLLNAEASWPNL